MASFSPDQPDEGYSEDPLNPTVPSPFAIKLRDDHDPTSPLSGFRSSAELPAWLVRSVSNMSISSKTR